MLESRRYLRRACKQAYEKSGGRGWGDGELWAPEPGFVGTWGPEKRSLLAFWWIPHVLEAGRGGGGGQVARALGAASRRPTRWDTRSGRRGARRAGARGPDRLNKAGARGLATHNKKLMSAAAWAAGSAVARPRGDDVDSQGRRGKEKGEEEEEGSAGYSAAATCSASLLPVAGRGGGSGKRTA